MKTRSIIVMAGATLLVASAFGGNLVRAFPAEPAPAPGVAQIAQATEAPYQWHGYFGPRLVVTDAYVPSCPLRKMWVDTDSGPRLKWRRACPDQG
ncbi:hypothetical protein EZH22_13555 [Xanthobacter dioxanivorans]|uniref:Uncharacterized protein n=1 Tax=Xanthobacter dioxanivorans TaxID=2528964 RepID=A0A974PSZ7_9HYPH|nr:hypothetical protein [Xanthobacter dioxanivorans]QRG09194.1 hypothetical protein EZH22_13555 [Xanthobacter dioxanivorans]